MGAYLICFSHQLVQFYEKSTSVHGMVLTVNALSLWLIVKNWHNSYYISWLLLSQTFLMKIFIVSIWFIFR